MWMLLLTLFFDSTHAGNGDENCVLHCQPPNLTLTSSGQTILLKWKDGLNCAALNGTRMYELVVLIADSPKHYDEVVVTPDHTDLTYSWNWTSPLPLECASHSVRLRLRHKNQKSSWELHQTLPGKKHLETAVFPQDKVFEVGSTVTFCCVLPAETSLSTMHVDGYDEANTNITMISSQTYTLTVQLSQPSQASCTNVYCNTNRSTSNSGTCAYIDVPPDDKDLQCETRDLKVAECQWRVGNNTNLGKTRKRYWLQGSECKHGSKGKCSIAIPPNATETKWTLTIKNELGKVELTDVADMTRRVHMLAPEDVRVFQVHARNASLAWSWSRQLYTSLNRTCQVNASDGETYTVHENFGDIAILKNLTPNWTYGVTVRCGTTSHLWKWGDWSQSVTFHTKGDVPEPLDVWMQMKKSHVVITWKKPLANQSHGNIADYTVTWAKSTEAKQQTSITVAPSERQVELSLDNTEEYMITVTARNINGSSSPSTITTPTWNPGRTRVNTSWITGSNCSFSLSWSPSPNASCGYTVDWCPVLGNCSVQWLKVPSNQTNTTIFSKNLKHGLRYILSIYACTQGAPLLLERREGYVQEERIKDGLFKQLKWNQRDSDVQVSWAPVQLKEQTAFIQGYILYWQHNNKSFSVSTADPEATSLTATKLKISSYTFTVKAQTAVGECGTTAFSATLNTLTDSLIKIVTISLVTISILLFLLVILCYRHWTCIKQKVYPPIPKPVLMDKWLTSLGEHTCRPLYVNQSLHSEADTIDVPELHRNTAAPVNGSSANAKTPDGYYNQHLTKSLRLPTAAEPSQSELPPSTFTQVFPNLSYNLMMRIGGQRSSFELQLQDGSISERSSSGYQPQSFTQTIDNPESSISCVSTYILLPHSPSK